MHHALDFHGRIDIWVNNAGISAGYRPLDELGVAELDEIVRVNLLGTLYACRLLVPYFREYGGVLLNMAGRGFRGDATPHTAAYAATKAAIASITRSLAEENRDCRRIHIHALVPGMVPTDFYRNVVVSPKLEHSRGNVDLALEAFGVPLDVVGTETAAYLGDGAWHATGQIHNLLKGARTARGAALMAWYGMTGKLKRER
jgi:NAD(P)-dependent dehydrogenase (short-subunit alcohol dehydrogenase family)